MEGKRIRTIFVSLMIGVFFMSLFFAAANAENGELTYSFKEGSPTAALYWQLTFPAECHPKDNINFSIFLNLETSMRTKFFVVIEAIIEQHWVTQYIETLLSEGDYSAGQNFNWQTTIVVPEKAYGNLRFFASTVYSNWGWLNLTYVRPTTYGELEQSYAQLNQSHTELSRSYIELNQSYVALNQSYTELTQLSIDRQKNYTLLDNKYKQLASTYEPFGEIANTRNLMFIFMALTIFFAATTAYSLLKRQRQ